MRERERARERASEREREREREREVTLTDVDGGTQIVDIRDKDVLLAVCDELVE